MNDADVRPILKTHILSSQSEGTKPLVIDEFEIDSGSARIDIAVIDSELQGYEIKSDNDNLARLTNQIIYYGKVFDTITLVVGYKHAYEAFQTIPRWWGVKLVEVNEQGNIEISEARDPLPNPSVDPVYVLNLLRKQEVLGILEDLGKAKGFRSKKKPIIVQRVTELLGISEIRDRTIACIRNRQGQTLV